MGIGQEIKKFFEFFCPWVYEEPGRTPGHNILFFVIVSGLTSIGVAVVYYFGNTSVSGAYEKEYNFLLH